MFLACCCHVRYYVGPVQDLGRASLRAKAARTIIGSRCVVLNICPCCGSTEGRSHVRTKFEVKVHLPRALGKSSLRAKPVQADIQVLCFLSWTIGVIPEPLSILNSTCPGAWERSRSQPRSDNVKIQTGSGQPVGPLSGPLRVRFQTQPAQGLGRVTFKTESRQHKNKRFQAVRVESSKIQFCVGQHILVVFLLG